MPVIQLENFPLPSDNQRRPLLYQGVEIASKALTCKEKVTRKIENLKLN